MHPVKKRKETRIHPLHGRDLAKYRNKPHPDAPTIPHVSNSKPHPKVLHSQRLRQKHTVACMQQILGHMFLPFVSGTILCFRSLQHSALCNNTRISRCQLKINDTSNTCCSKIHHFHPCASLLWRLKVRVWTFKSCSVHTPGNSPHRALSFAQQLLLHQRPRIITHRLTLLRHLTNPLAPPRRMFIQTLMLVLRAITAV